MDPHTGIPQHEPSIALPGTSVRAEPDLAELIDTACEIVVTILKAPGNLAPAVQQQLSQVASKLEKAAKLKSGAAPPQEVSEGRDILGRVILKESDTKRFAARLR